MIRNPKLAKKAERKTACLWSVVIYPHNENWKFPKRCPDGVQYMMGQLEMTSTGQLHYQLFVRTNRPACTVTEVKKRLGVTACKIKPCFSSEFNNVDYCSKENTRVEGPWEIGVKDKRVHDKVHVDTVQHHQPQEIEVDYDLMYKILHQAMKIDEEKEQEYQRVIDAYWQDYKPL